MIMLILKKNDEDVNNVDFGSLKDIKTLNAIRRPLGKKKI